MSLTPRRISDVFEADITGADCVEARLDYLADPGESFDVDWGRLPVPVIATCRGKERGGRFPGPIQDEVDILDRAVRNGARWVDVDFRFARSFGSAEVIGSYHDFDETPADVGRWLARACESTASVAKLAAMVRSWSDNRRLLDLLAEPWPKPVIVIGMGALGQMTRVLGPSRGSRLTYASSGEASAPGQLSLAELLDTYRVRRISPETRVVGIVGNPVEHSASPGLHNRAFGVAGLDWVYLKFPVERVADFMEQAGGLDIEGFSVTIPHKVEVIRYLDELTPEARAAGAVNTVYRRRGAWIGENTDVHGVRESLKDLDLTGADVVVLGTGGAARAAVAALDGAASVTLLSRSRPPGVLEWSRTVRVDRLENASSYRADLLINATPVGMSPRIEETPLSGPGVGKVVFDMIYNPVRTRLIEEAERQGRQTISGMKMFLAQASRQFEIWTGQIPPAEVFALEDS